MPSTCQPYELPVEECDVEARVVRDQHGVLGERQEAADGELDGRGAPQREIVESRQ